VPAARAALTSARDAAPRSAAACDGVWLAGGLDEAVVDALDDDVPPDTEVDGVPPERFAVVPDHAPLYPPTDPDGEKRPAPYP
jgi:hypothetical protein